MARSMFRFLPVRLLLRFRYDTRAAVARVRCPVLIAHSVNDEMIPFAHAEALYAAASGSRALVRLTAGHNDGGIETHPDYRATLLAMLQAPP